MKTVLWRSPSGRLHWMRQCSGGATKRNTTKATLPDEQLAALPYDALCRCAWRAREKAVARLAEQKEERS